MLLPKAASLCQAGDLSPRNGYPQSLPHTWSWTLNSNLGSADWYLNLFREISSLLVQNKHEQPLCWSSSDSYFKPSPFSTVKKDFPFSNPNPSGCAKLWNICPSCTHWQLLTLLKKVTSIFNV